MHTPPSGSGQALQVRPATVDDVARVVAFLDAAEAAVGVPLVDEAERVRLTQAARDPSAASTDWWRAVAVDADGGIVGYAALLDGVGELAVGDGPLRATTTTRLAQQLREHLTASGPSHDATVWMRRVTPDDVAAVTAAGAAVRRRLGVLGRGLEADLASVPAPDGVRIRPYRGEADDAHVVEVLAAAYAGTDDGGWDLAAFRERRALPWFRDEDLLLAVLDDGSPGGLHWMKRRDARTGEVYNLAVHPRAQGRGLGAALLSAGVAHLAATGCREAILWVDLGNQAAVRLYEAQGFAERWQDVAFDLPPA